MADRVFNDSVLRAIESVYDAVKEETDLVKENRKNNPDSNHYGSFVRSVVNATTNYLQKTSRVHSAKGVLGSNQCQSCALLWNVGTKKCKICNANSSI